MIYFAAVAIIALWPSCRLANFGQEYCQFDPGIVDLIMRGAGTRQELYYIELVCNDTAPMLMDLVRHVRPWHADRSGDKHSTFATQAHQLLLQRCGPEPLSHERCNTLPYLRDDPISEAAVAGTMLYEMVVADVGDIRARWLALRIARASFNDDMVTFGLLGVDQTDPLPVWHGGPRLPQFSVRVVDGVIAGPYLPPPPTLETYLDPFVLGKEHPFFRYVVFEDLHDGTPLSTYVERKRQLDKQYVVGIRAVVPDVPTDARVKVPSSHDHFVIASLDNCFGPCEEPTLFATLGASRWTLRQGARELIGGTRDEVLRELRRVRCDMSVEPVWDDETIGLIGDDTTTVGDALRFIAAVNAEPISDCRRVWTSTIVLSGDPE